MPAIFYAFFTVIATSAWSTFHKLGAPFINQVFGAILISATAVVFGLAIFMVAPKTGSLVVNAKGIYFVLGAGIAAFLIDFFTLQAYSKGLSLSIGGPIMIAMSVVLTATIGFFLFNESVSLMKVAGIFLVVSGCAVLALAAR